MHNPLPQEYLLGVPRAAGAIKERAGDFRVEEVPLYTPSGSGEHLYLLIRKRCMSHGDMVSAVASHFGVSPRSVGYAGMKDKVADTVQAITVHTNSDFDARMPIHPRIEVLDTSRHQSKMRRGHLAGNRFTIAIRRTTSSTEQALRAGLNRLAHTGVPNYFGEQRFGYRLANHLVGASILKRHWSSALDALLGPLEGYPDPISGDARRLYAEGKYREARNAWRHGYPAERAALSLLAQGADSRRAILGVGRGAIGFYVSAAQSAIFNRVLDKRVRSGTFDVLRVGDVGWSHRNRRVFRIDASTLSKHETAARISSVEISPSGPMWGDDMMRAGDLTDKDECEGLAWLSLSPKELRNPPCACRGTRRPLRVRLTDVDVRSGEDDHGPFVRVQFTLERGAYATVVLRELLSGPEHQVQDRPARLSGVDRTT